jgi:hypothetical protein
MPNYSAKDRDGNNHCIWIQEKPQSCALACVYMIERIVKRMSVSGGEARLRAISQLFPNGFIEGFGVNSTEVIAKVLTTIGIPASHQTQPASSFPFIVRVEWNNKKAGGHFVVAAGLNRNGDMIFYDPIFGLVELTEADLDQRGYVVTNNVRLNRSQSKEAEFSGNYVVI